MEIKNAIENTKDSGMNELVCLFLGLYCCQLRSRNN